MDMLDGLATVRHAFMAAGLRPPTVLLLETHEEGMRFLSAMRQQNTWTVRVGDPALGKVVTMVDGSVWMECKVMGICVRWPANRYALPDGSFNFG